MNSTLIRKGWLVGVLVAALVGWGALAAVAGSGHVGSHPRIASSSAPANPQVEPAENAVEVEHLATPSPQAKPEQENEAAENEAAENEDNDEDEDEDEAPAPAPPTGATTTSRTFSLIGGTVSVTCTGNVISLNSATPKSGFTVETERKDDRQKIEVRFRSETHESRIEVRCQNGQVVAEEIREEAD